VPAIIASHRSELERYYTCPRCGAKGEATLTAVGHSVWGGASLIGIFANLAMFRFGRLADAARGGNAQDEAEFRAQRDADRVLALLRCPSCKKRPLMAFVWPVIRVVGYAIAGAMLAVFAAMFHVTVAPSVAAGVGAAIAVLGELGRFARVRNTVTVRLANAPVAQLPEAREAVVAPESEPTSPADEPSVLR
jgi:DNA-directed RNA polymerase subunit RPC12/RpoP